MRKEDALCHVACFIGFLVIYFASVYFSSNTGGYKPKPTAFSDILQNLDKMLEIDADVPPPVPENELIQSSDGNNGLGCSLYVTDSSLPKSGLGIFTVKSFKEGEIIIPENAAIKVDDVDFNPYIVLMKQHSSYDNVQGGDTGSAIVASKDIQEGHELFFKFEDYSSNFKKTYQSLHLHDPTMAIFEKVDTISSKIIDSIPKKKVQIKSNRKKSYKQKDSPKYAMKPSVDATNLLQTVKDIFQDYDSVMASLLPDTHAEAQSMINAGGRAMYIAKNRTSEWLSKNGVCVDGIHPFSKDNRNGAFSTRKVLKGDVVTTSPLYVTQSTSLNQKCFCLNSDGLMICPLSFASYVNNGVTSTQCDSANNDECPRNIANTYYQWSKFNSLNRNIENLSIEELLKVSDFRSDSIIMSSMLSCLYADFYYHTHTLFRIQ